MTKGLWEGDDRYLETYWSRYPGAWLQGDFATSTGTGFWYLHGRSDDTIMVAGKRIGPAEIESVLVSDPSVVEAAAVGVPDEIKGEALVCFVVLRLVRIADHRERLEATIVGAEGRHGPARSTSTRSAELPKTRNGKVMRRIAKAAYLGDAVGDVTALDNPEVLPHYESTPSRGRREWIERAVSFYSDGVRLSGVLVEAGRASRRPALIYSHGWSRRGQRSGPPADAEARSRRVRRTGDRPPWLRGQ